MADSMKSGLVSALQYTDNIYTKDGVDEAISNALKGGYKPKGSVSAVTDLPTLAATCEGWMYNMSSDFTTTADFVEGSGKSFPAGTNVICVNAGTDANPSYKWDVLAGQGAQPSSTTPKANGTAAAGTENAFARGDHVHPTDTTRAPTSHASSADTYGKGTGTNYGHVKLSDATDGTAAAASGGTAATPKAVSDALAAAKTYADGANVNVIEGVKLEGASANLAPSSKVVTIPNAVPTGTGETNGLMTAADKAKLNGIAAGAQVNVIEGVKIDGASSNLSPSSKVVTIPSASTSAKGVVQLSDSTSSNVSTTAATSKAVKSAKDAADSAATAASGAAGTANAEKSARTTTLKTAMDAIAATGTTLAQVKAGMASLGDTKDLVASLVIALRNFVDAATA